MTTERYPSLLALRNQAKLEQPAMPDEYLNAIATLAQCAYEEQLEGTFIVAHSRVRLIALEYLRVGPI